MKDQLLKGLKECLPKDRPYLGGRNRRAKLYNQALSEVRTALEGWVKGLEIRLDEGEILNKLNKHQSESIEEVEYCSVVDKQELAKALASSGEIIRVKI